MRILFLLDQLFSFASPVSALAAAATLWILLLSLALERKQPTYRLIIMNLFYSFVFKIKVRISEEEDNPAYRFILSEITINSWYNKIPGW